MGPAPKLGCLPHCATPDLPGLCGEQLTALLSRLPASGTEESSCGWSSLPGWHVSLVLGWRLQGRCRSSLVKDSQFFLRQGNRGLHGHMGHHGSLQEPCWTATHEQPGASSISVRNSCPRSGSDVQQEHSGGDSPP